MQIVENEKDYLDDFTRLNEEWITAYFELEENDRALAANPYQIIENGGYIFSLVSEGEVIGVCALVNEGNGTYQLVRMAVSPKHQGEGLSHKLMQACLSKLSRIGAKKVYLLSNTQLKAAIALYKKHGFKTVSLGPHPAYSRVDIVMERDVH
jgi:N-acetylglutamate synthase-like GNAT family acetyltransferase